MGHIYRILPLPPREGNKRQRRNFRNDVFVSIFLTITASDTAVKKAFLELGEVQMYLLANLKSHITISVMANAILKLLPIQPSPWNILWRLLAFLGHVRWEESIMQKSVCVHRLRDTCNPAPYNFTNEGSTLIMWILYWLQWRVEGNELPLRMQDQI